MDLIPVTDDDGNFLYYKMRFYAQLVASVATEHSFYWNPTTTDWWYWEPDGNQQNAVGEPDGDWFRTDCFWVRNGGTRGYWSPYSMIVFLDFGIPLKAPKMAFDSYGRSNYDKEGWPAHPIYGTNNPDAWGYINHEDWGYVTNWGWMWPEQDAWTWTSGITHVIDEEIPAYRYWAWVRDADRWGGTGKYADFQSFRITLDPGGAGKGRPPYRFAASLPGSKALVCDHQYGDTLYLGLRRSLQERPVIVWVDWDFYDHNLGYWATAGSSVGVQTVELRDTCIAYGQFGTDKQIIISEDKLVTWDEAQGEFGDDDVLTLESHPSSGSNLIATRKVDQDYIQTLTQRAPWTDMGDTPFVARSQLRVGDDIWIGSETGGSSVVRLLSGGSGNDWVDKSVGLPNVPINDLESA